MFARRVRYDQKEKQIFFVSILTIGIKMFREVNGVWTSDLWNQKQLSYHLFITFSCLGAVGLCRRGLGLKSPDLKSPALNGLVWNKTKAKLSLFQACQTKLIHPKWILWTIAYKIINSRQRFWRYLNALKSIIKPLLACPVNKSEVRA